ncbi:hypothetical protein N6L24_04035 [Cognatishimia sp. SS12]|uniref:hypothetical protein n=1 Tax=Cognatishimia sp. SS12 TaxID=2979465 RepID=UPI00232BCF34|nr:hypothetical protein [Cognatishimia sp. SS12]MDC0737433.1 hypothetical protein [Cognatishimia sp. SS12]
MKILVTAAASLLIASQAFAGSYQTRCTTTSVPYQATVKGGQPEKVIGGALIGGVIGKVVTDKNAGAAAGAVIGGVVGHENSRRTVTRYKDVETCKNVYVPARINDRARLENAIFDLNAGRSVSKELVKDVQYTIGVSQDGKWGPKSRRAADNYLGVRPASLRPVIERPAAPLYSLIVNDVLIHSTDDVDEVQDMQVALLEAGVTSNILVDSN